MDFRTETVTFLVSTTLRKPLDLPNQNKWRVYGEDAALAGIIICNTTYKGLFFKHKSPIDQRFLTVTQQGFLIVYEQEDKGYVLDIRQALALTTETDTFESKTQSYRRCHLKMKFTFGSLNMYLMNEDISRWKRVITNIFDCVCPSALALSRSSPSNENLTRCFSSTMMSAAETGMSTIGTTAKSCSKSDSISGISMTETFVPSTTTDMDSFFPTMTSTSQVPKAPAPSETSIVESVAAVSVSATTSTTTTTTTTGPTVIEVTDSTNSGLITDHPYENISATEELQSVRCGYQSVAAIRRNLESKLDEKQKKCVVNRNVAEKNRRQSIVYPRKVRSAPSKTPSLSRFGTTFTSTATITTTPSGTGVGTKIAAPVVKPVAPPRTMSLRRERQRTLVFSPGYDSWDKSVRA